MTKDQYFEMCEALGSTPKEEEIPIDYEDLPWDVQEALKIYGSLQDCWDYFNGNYIGKNMAGFKDILDIYEVPPEDRRTMFEFIMKIDSIRSKAFRDSKPKK